MARTKHHREKKRQLGQFLTPPEVAERILAGLPLRPTDRVLEPGFGGGAFLIPLIEELLRLRHGDLDAVLHENVWGIELDHELYRQTLDRIQERWGDLPSHHTDVPHFSKSIYAPTSTGACTGVDARRHVQQLEHLLLQRCELRLKALHDLALADQLMAPHVAEDLEDAGRAGAGTVA